MLIMQYLLYTCMPSPWVNWIICCNGVGPSPAGSDSPSWQTFALWACTRDWKAGYDSLFDKSTLAQHRQFTKLCLVYLFVNQHSVFQLNLYWEVSLVLLHCMGLCVALVLTIRYMRLWPSNYNNIQVQPIQLHLLFLYMDTNHSSVRGGGSQVFVTP